MVPTEVASRQAEQAAGDVVFDLATRIARLPERERSRLGEVLGAMQSRDRDNQLRGNAVNLGKDPGPSTMGAGAASWAGGPSTRSDEITLENIDEVMVFQPWDGYQADCGTQVREALTFAAKTILRLVPAGRFRAVALRDIFSARMNANAGISFRGRF